MGKQKVTPEMEKQIIELYISGLSSYKISLQMKVSESTVLRYLNKANIFIRGNKIDKDTITKIISLYNQGYSQEKIEYILGVSRPIVRKYLKENNQVIRTQTQTSRRYSLNEEYFNELNHQNKYWILGFFYADGNVSKSDANIQIGLQERDIDALHKMQKEFNSDRPLYFIDRHSKNIKLQNIALLSIDSIQMKNDLVKWGVAPQKTHFIGYPDFIPEDMHSHFLRGVLDGDGSIGRTKTGRHRCRYVYICGTKNFCIEAKKIIEKYVGVYCHLRKVQKNKETYSIIVSGIYNSIKFLNWIYMDAELYLERKYQIYQQYYINEVWTA